MQRIFVLIGIINQLASTRLNRVLSDLDLPMAQFYLLTHLSHNPSLGWTVTELAEVMEVNQPAMTKTTQRLLKKSYLRVETDRKDKRIRYNFITNNGLEALTGAWGLLLPDMEDLQSCWNSEDLTDLQNLLEKLKEQLDEARE